MYQRLLKSIPLGALAAALAFSQPAPPPGQEQFQGDPPTRAARLSFVTGNVSFNPAGVEDWAAAQLNRPMTTGDKLWTEADGRAEVHIGTSVARIGGNTSFAFINLDDATTQVQVAAGSVCIRVRRLLDNEVYEIDTPQLALTVTRPGDYRVDVSEQDGSTVVTVRSNGEAEINASGQPVTVHQREQ